MLTSVNVAHGMKDRNRPVHLLVKVWAKKDTDKQELYSKVICLMLTLEP